MKCSIFVLALAAALPLSAQAAPAGLDYSYVQAGYASVHHEASIHDGWSATGSYGFSDHFYATASYTDVSESFDLGQAEVDRGLSDTLTQTETEVGLGFHFGISDRIDVIGEAAYFRRNQDFHVNLSESGYKASVGFRGLPTQRLEASFVVYYLDIGPSGLGATARVTFHFNDTWAVYAGADGSVLGDTSQGIFTAGVRVSF